MAFVDENLNPVTGGTPLPATGATVQPTASDSGSGGWLSGLGGLFQGTLTGISNVIKAEQPTARPYVPYYTATGINPSVAQPLGLGALFNSPILLLLLAVGAYFVFRKK